jgi:hypothetical protein
MKKSEQVKNTLATLLIFACIIRGLYEIEKEVMHVTYKALDKVEEMIKKAFATRNVKTEKTEAE